MSFQAYNMIPSHGIRSGFGMRHAVFFLFVFLGCFAYGYPQILVVKARLVEKSFM